MRRRARGVVGGARVSGGPCADPVEYPSARFAGGEVGAASASCSSLVSRSPPSSWMCLLALSDSGVSSYDHNLAKKLANVGVPCFACTPNVLPQMLEAALKGKNLEAVAAKFDTRKT